MYTHFKERSHRKILFSHPNDSSQHWDLVDMVYNEFSSTNNSVYLFFCFFLVTNDEKKSLLRMENKNQDQKETKGLELFDPNNII